MLQGENIESKEYLQEKKVHKTQIKTLKKRIDGINSLLNPCLKMQIQNGKNQRPK